MLTIQFALLFFFLLIFSFFPPRFCLGDISGTVTCRDSKLSVLLGPAVQLSTVAYHPICFVIFFSFNFFLFSTTILSGPYFWNRYLQRLQIECAARSCGPIEHCCLPSNSALLFFFLLIFSFFPPRFCVGHISGTVTRRDSKLSVLLGPVVQLSTFAYHPICFVIFFFF